ncbi:MAG: hypothetical protein AB7O24_15975 [Kofleriaceae bacterium]
MTSSEPRLSFRTIPPVFHFGLALGLIGPLVVTLASLWVGNDWARHAALDRWYLFQAACDVVWCVLYALGLLALANRTDGRTRAVARAAGYLSLVGLAYLVVPLVTTLVAQSGNRSEHVVTIHTWAGRIIGVTLFIGTMLFTLAADAWRRAPIAAIMLVILHGTSWWVPYIGEAISELFRDDPSDTLTGVYVYGLSRDVVMSAALLVVAAAMAGRGRDLSPDPQAAAHSLRRARGALLFRIGFGISIAMLGLSTRSETVASFIALTTPLIAIATMVIFTFALHRVVTARLAGMPRTAIVVGVTLLLWQCGVQVRQVIKIALTLWNDSGFNYISDLQQFSVMGPVAATLGIALIGLAIVTYAGRRGDQALWYSGVQRTIGFVLLSLVSLWLQARIPEAHTQGSALALIIGVAATSILGQVMIAGLLGRAARSIEPAESGELPMARVVIDIDRPAV